MRGFSQLYPFTKRYSVYDLYAVVCKPFCFDLCCHLLKVLCDLLAVYKVLPYRCIHKDSKYKIFYVYIVAYIFYVIVKKNWMRQLCFFFKYNTKNILDDTRIVMKVTEKLQNLLENEIIPDLEAAIDELFAKIDKAKNASKVDKDDLEEMHDMRTECFAMVEEIKRDEMDEKEAEELLEAFLDMKTEENPE